MKDINKEWFLFLLIPIVWGGWFYMDNNPPHTYEEASRICGQYMQNQIEEDSKLLLYSDVIFNECMENGYGYTARE